ncbi:MAG: GTPase Era [Clostridiales bacterium]|nr:GTPase Era [Clostridiales bacterium]MCC8099145.1 GTPase Era [Clostridiales bacterium]
MEIKKSGIITIVGRPNVGKSTLLNALVGEKIAIVSHKPQTTRNRICGIVTKGDKQFVFTDTPGLNKARNRLGEYMEGVVRASINDVDAAVLVVEPVPTPGEQEKELMRRIKAIGVPAVLVINKVDTLEQKEKVLEVIAAYQALHDFADIVPLSALKRDGVDELLQVLERFLPEGPELFPQDMTTDQPEKQVMAEILREKMLMNLNQEIPHGTAVEITKFSERDSGIIDCEATIYCEKANHKGIIIGKHGDMLKRISTSARIDMERFMGTKVFLTTWVKVKENWRDDLMAVQNFGYRDE